MPDEDGEIDARAIRDIQRRLRQLDEENNQLRRESTDLQKQLVTLSANPPSREKEDGSKLRPFTGEPGGPSFQSWIRQFEAKAKYQNWTEAQKPYKLMGSLHDPALVFAQDLEEPVQASFGDLKDALSKKYQLHNTDYYALLLGRRRQKPNESVAQFAHALLEIAKCAFPPTPTQTTLDTEVRRQFVTGLRPELMWEVMREQPVKFDDAVNLAERISHERQLFEEAVGRTKAPEQTSVEGVSPVEVASTTDIAKKLDQLLLQHESKPAQSLSRSDEVVGAVSHKQPEQSTEVHQRLDRLEAMIEKMVQGPRDRGGGRRSWSGRQRGGGSQAETEKPYCSHCRRTGHTYEECYSKNRNPQKSDWKNQGRGRYGSTFGAAAKTNTDSQRGQPSFANNSGVGMMNTSSPSERKSTTLAVKILPATVFHDAIGYPEVKVRLREAGIKAEGAGSFAKEVKVTKIDAKSEHPAFILTKINLDGLLLEGVAETEKEAKNKLYQKILLWLIHQIDFDVVVRIFEKHWSTPDLPTTRAEAKTLVQELFPPIESTAVMSRYDQIVAGREAKEREAKRLRQTRTALDFAQYYHDLLDIEYAEGQLPNAEKSRQLAKVEWDVTGPRGFATLEFRDVSVGDRLIFSSQRDRYVMCYGVVVRLIDQESDLIHVELFPDEEGDNGSGSPNRLFSQPQVNVMKDPNARTFQVQDRTLSCLVDEEESFPRYFNSFLSGPSEALATEVDLPETMPRSLNNSQTEAVKLALRENMSLIQGPPGTGKTTTAAAIVFAQCNLSADTQQNQKILVCAPSNVAVDELALRIREALPKDLLVTRVFSTCMEPWLSSSAKELSLTRLALHGGCQKLRDMHKGYLNNALDYRDMPRYRKMLKSAQERVLREAKVICCTNSGSACRLIRSLPGRFQLVLIDEAGQTTVPEAMVPLVATRAAKAVFIGDHKQLRPTILSQKAQQRKLNESILEYLVNFGFKPHVLTDQYRMPPIVAEFSNTEFYGGVLRHQAKHTFLDTLPSGSPLLMWSISSQSRREFDSNSCYNELEANAVVESVTALVNKAGVQLGAIGVITPYRAQKRLIQSKLPAGMSVPVDTIDAYQGREKDVIIISLVRAETTGTQGFLKDVRRLNVMLTRARRAMIVICDIKKLCLLPDENIFIRLKGYSNRNRCLFYSNPWNEWTINTPQGNDQCHFESEVPSPTRPPSVERVAHPSKTRLLVDAVIDGRRVSALLDTGAHSSLIKRSVLNPKPGAISPATLQITGVTQHSVEISGLVWVDVTVGNRTGNYPLHLVSDSCAYDAILGEDILETWDVHRVIAKHLDLDARCFNRESQAENPRVTTVELLSHS